MSATSVKKQAKDLASRQICTFFVDKLFLGIQATKVQEVIRFQPLTPVPLAPESVSGLMNLRGQIVTAIDLRRLLDLAPRNAQATPMNVVVRCKDSTVSLQVDDVGDVVEVDEASFELPPQTLNARARMLVRGVHKLEGKLLLLIDTDVVTKNSVLNVVESNSGWKNADQSRRYEDAQS